MPPRPLRPMPCHDEREARQRGLLDGLDLAPQPGDGRAADAAQHLDVAPLAAAAAGTQRAAHELPARSSADELALGDGRLEVVAARRAAASGNGPRQRAKRATSERSASGTGSRNAAGMPPGGMAPSASR